MTRSRATPRQPAFLLWAVTPQNLLTKGCNTAKGLYLLLVLPVSLPECLPHKHHLGSPNTLPSVSTDRSQTVIQKCTLCTWQHTVQTPASSLRPKNPDSGLPPAGLSFSRPASCLSYTKESGPPPPWSFTSFSSLNYPNHHSFSLNTERVWHGGAYL